MVKEEIHALLLWGIIAYAVAVLTYLTLKIFNHGADFVSGFGSILSAVATFFAAYVAVQLFSDWKDQHNKQVINNFGIQVYEQFSILENNVSQYKQHLDHLISLIDSYEYELNIDMLIKHGNIIYLSNVTDKQYELKISFKNLYSKLQAYSIVLGTLDNDYKRYNGYLDVFNDSYMFDDEIFYLRKNTNFWSINYFKTLDLLNEIRYSEIEKLLINLKAQ